MVNIFSVAFYNLENLFDSEHNKFTLDKDFTPDGVFQWDQDRYQRKIQNLSKVISNIGLKQSKLPPVFLGVCEVEYDFVHYDSPDERGIDVACLYQKKYFELIYSDTYTLLLTDNDNNRDYTRDILLISGKLFNEQIYIIINHWPSRNNGIKTSDDKRIKAAKLVGEIVTDIYNENENPYIIIMGDFNDNPTNKSVKNHLMNPDFYNPMLDLEEKKKGSVMYHGKWYMFDQIIVNKAFLDSGSSKINFKSAEIFDASFLKQKTGKRKGRPKRTFIGKYHQGGFSDHFPVLAYFQKHF